MSITQNTPTPRPGDVLAVVSQSGHRVDLRDAADHSLRAVVDVPAEPHELCFDADHGVLYVSVPYVGGAYGAHHGHNHLVAVVDPYAAQVVDVIDLSPECGPHGLALDPARGLLYVSVEAGPAGTGAVVVVDTATRRVLRRIDTLAPGPHWFALHPSGERGWAANKEAPFLSVVDLTTGTLLDKIAVPGSEGIAVSPDGSTVAVAAPAAFAPGADPEHPAAQPGVRLIDARTGVIERILPTEDPVLPVHWTGTGVLVAGQLRPGAPVGRLSVWAGASPAEVGPAGSVDVGAGPLTITSSPDGGRVAVAAVLGSSVTVVDVADPARPAVLDTVDVARGGGPGAHGLAYVPARS